MTGMLDGKRILVVEDEYFIASDIKRELARKGAHVVGPVGSLADGLSLVDEALDAAVLDVNLEEALSYPIADRLGDHDVPYIFLTGYDCWSLPATYREVPRLAKPFSSGALVGMMERLVANGPDLAGGRRELP